MTHAGEVGGWLLDARTYAIAVAAWLAVVVLYGFWRSGGGAAQDPIRPSGPIE
jgi:hypothetical protein